MGFHATNFVKKTPIDIDSAIQETRQRFDQIPASLRPHKTKRMVRRRSEEEAIALARAVYHSVLQAEKTGYIQKIPGGYRMVWTSEKK